MSDGSVNLSKLDANQVLRMSYDDDKNRLRVAADITAQIGEIAVAIDAADGDNIAIADPTGTNYLLPNSDGSLNVIADIVLNQSQDSVAIGDGITLGFVDPITHALLVSLNSTNLTTKNLFNEITGIPSGVTSVIETLTVSSQTKLLSVDVGGTNIAAYSIYISSALQAKKYTFYQNLNETFQFGDGLPVPNGSTISVEVIHNRPDPGDFSCNVLILN